MSGPENASSTGFLQLPWEIRDMIWSAAWANRKPEVCTHLFTRPPTNGLPGFAPPQLVVDIDLALMHICRESRAFLTSNVGGVRFRYSLVARINVPCRAFDPALDTLYLGGHNYEDAMLKNEYLGWHGRYAPHDLPTLPDNQFVDCWRDVENIALEPGVMLYSRIFNSTPEIVSRLLLGISATFPQLRNISIVVNPFVDLESSYVGEVAVCPPGRRCRLVEAAGETTWPERQPRMHWLDTCREEVKRLQTTGHTASLSVQIFEVYTRRRGQMQWRKHPQ